MQDDGDPCERYADMFDGFFRNPDMASTYKPVLLAALVDIAARKGGGPLDAGKWISSGGGRVHVDLELAAVPFAKYYWDMIAGFGPRHTPVRMADPDDPGKDINIVGLINDEVARMKEEEAREKGTGAGKDAAGKARSRRGMDAPASDKPPTLAQLASDKMAGFRRRVVAKSIKPVVLGKLRKGEFNLYEIERGGNGIVLGEEAMAYMKRNAVALKTALGELVTRHLEANNPSARHVATMVNMNEEYASKIKKVINLERKAMAQRDDLGPLYAMSMDLAAGLACLYRTRS